MEDFAKMVEVYKWRAGAPKQNESFASLDPPPAPVHQDGGVESAGSGCTGGSLPKIDENYSSPSPSFLQNMGHDFSIETKKIDAVGAEVPDRALSFAPNWHRPRQRHLLKKKPRSLHSRSTRQLVFSVEDLKAKGSAEGSAKSKRTIKRNRCKRNKVELKQVGEELISQVQACDLPDFYDDSECENGPSITQEFYSPGISSSPGQDSPSNVVTGCEEKGGTERTRNLGTQNAFTYVKSPYFVSSKQNAKLKGANKGRLTKKCQSSSAKVKPCIRRQKKEGSAAKIKADITENKDLPGHCIESLDLEDSGEQSAHLSKQSVDSTYSGSLHRQATSGTKKSAYFETPVKALGQRDIVNKTWVPPISVHALIQEELYKDPWKVLVACMLLNKTSGRQMRKIIWDLFDLCPTPEAAVTVETSKIEDVIRGLGLQKKRARMIQKFSNDYLGKDWTNVGQLHGIGKYATDAYAIFCEGRWQEAKPEDHKLVDYWKYLCATDGLGYAFKDDREKVDELRLELSMEM